jgi:nitric oxide reductase NorQ protein
VSTRLLVYAGRLIGAKVRPFEACRVALAYSLTDDPAMYANLTDLIRLYFPDESES